MKKMSLKRICCLFLSAILLGSVVSTTLPVMAATTTTTYNFEDGNIPFEPNDSSLAEGNQTFTYEGDASLLLHDRNDAYANYVNGVSGTAFTSVDKESGTEALTRTHGYVMSIGDESHRPTRITFDMKVVSGDGSRECDVLVIYPLTYSKDVLNSDSTNPYSNHLAMDIVSRFDHYIKWQDTSYDGIVATGSPSTDASSVFSDVTNKSVQADRIGWSPAEYFYTSNSAVTNTELVANTTEYSVTITYDWLENNQVTISAALSQGMPYTYSFTVTYDPNHITDMYHFGFLANTFGYGDGSADNRFLMDNLTLVTEEVKTTSQQEAELNALYEAFNHNKCSDTALAFIQAYAGCEDTSVKASFTDEYASVITWGNEMYTFTGFDDFSDTLKSYMQWSNLSPDAIQNDKVTLTGATEKISISEDVWKTGYKPSEVRFTAKASDSSGAPNSTTGLQFNMLDAGDVNAYLKIGVYRQNSDGSNDNSTGVGAGPSNSSDAPLKMSGYQMVSVTPDDDGWRSNPNVFNNGTLMFYSAYGTSEVEYILKYDWSRWESENTVDITFTSQTDATKPVKISEISYTYTGDSKPETFNVGFQNLSGTSTIDNVEITYLDASENTVEPTIPATPNALGASLSTDSDSMKIKLGFDFRTAKRAVTYEAYDDATVQYGAVLVAGTQDYDTMTQAADTLLDDDSSNDVTGYTVTKRTLSANEVLPDEYYITVTNSDGENVGKRISAVSYVITTVDGLTSIHYSQTVINHSPMSILKAIYSETYLPANTSGNAIVEGSALAEALAAYNEENSTSETLDTIKTAIGKGTTSLEQRNMLINIHYALCE